jgi:hypothetical protein
MKAPISAAIAIATGILILLGYFIDIPILTDLRTVMLQWAIILAAFALIVGIINLLRVHWGKLRKGKSQGVYSAVLMLSFAITVIIAGVFSPSGELSTWLFTNVQQPIEGSLMALLAIVLILATIRLMRRKMNAFSVTFIVTAFLVLIGTTPLLGLGEISALSLIRKMIIDVPAVAGARGILLGVSIGAIVTGLRVLIGADRPYGG